MRQTGSRIALKTPASDRETIAGLFNEQKHCQHYFPASSVPIGSGGADFGQLDAANAPDFSARARQTVDGLRHTIESRGDVRWQRTKLGFERHLDLGWDQLGAYVQRNHPTAREWL